MESEGLSSSSKRSSGGRRELRSSGSTQGFLAERVTNDRDGAAPKCHCGVYAILYMSKTQSNPNRLFFGCPFFKVQLQYCKYFMWLYSHTAKFGKGVAGIGVGGEIKEDFDEHFSHMTMENRVADLERRVDAIEKKKLGMCSGIYVLCVFVVVACMFFIKVLG